MSHIPLELFPYMYSYIKHFEDILNNPDKLYRHCALFANSKTCDVTIVIKFLEAIASFSLPVC